jgi:hypothetical protein
MLVLFTFFRLLLAAVFAIAAVAKLRAPAPTRADLVELGLPAYVAAAVTISLDNTMLTEAPGWRLAPARWKPCRRGCCFRS